MERYINKGQRLSMVGGMASLVHFIVCSKENCYFAGSNKTIFMYFNYIRAFIIHEFYF